MATAYRFQLGLLPERRMDWRTLATSYGIEVLLILFMINVGLIWPDRMQIAQKYHVTEIIPLPDMQPKPLQVKKAPPVIKAKLLPAAPVAAPRLVVPHEIRRAQAPKPEIVVLADVSGSVATFSRFTLNLLIALDSRLSRLRAFSFVDGLADITELVSEARAGGRQHIAARAAIKGNRWDGTIAISRGWELAEGGAIGDNGRNGQEVRFGQRPELCSRGEKDILVGRPDFGGKVNGLRVHAQKRRAKTANGIAGILR